MFEEKDIINKINKVLRRGRTTVRCIKGAALAANNGVSTVVRNVISQQYKAQITNMNANDIDYLCKLVGDALTLLLMIYRDRSPENITFALVNFARLRFSGSLLYATYKKLLISFAEETLEFDATQEEYCLQSENLISDARFALDSYDVMKKSPIYKKVYKCVMFGLSMSLFEKLGITFDRFGYSKMEQAVLSRGYKSKGDFIYTILDTILFIAERGYQIYQTGDISTIFHSGSKYGEVYDMISDIKRKSKVISNPEAHGFTESEFMSNLDSVIDKLTSINKHSTCLDKVEKALVKSKLDEMLMLRDDLTTKSACRQTRDMPFGILLAGDSGIGKSTLIEYIFHYFGKYKKLPTDSEFKYVVNFFAKYWNGYNTSCWCVILDDVAAEDPKLGDPTSVHEIIQVMNPVPYCPDQAALEDKGRTPCKAKLVIATTNVKSLNAFHYFSCPSAVQRRFPYIVTPSVKDEYKNEQGMLHSSLVTDTRAYKDLWTFKVEMVCPVPIAEGKQQARLKLISDKMSQLEFFSWLKETIDAFDMNQSAVSAGLDALSQAQLCSECKLPEQMCLCGKLKVESEDISYWYLTLAILFGVFIKWFKSSKIYRFMVKTYQFIHLAYMVYVISESKCKFVDHKIRMALDRFGTRDKWTSMGDKVQRSLRHPTLLSTIAVVLSCAVSIKFIHSRFRVQGSVSSSIGEVPEPDDIERKRENVWYSNDMPLAPFDLSRKSRSARSEKFSDFIDRLSRNCVYLHIPNPGEPGFFRISRCTGIGGHVYITNNHTIPDLVTSTKIKLVQSDQSAIGGNQEICLSESDLRRYPDEDLCFLILRSLPPKRNIVDYFCSNTVTSVMKGAKIMRCSDGSIQKMNIECIHGRRSTIRTKEVSFTNYLWFGRGSPTATGDCGGLLISDTDFGYIVLGFHVARHKDTDEIVFSRVTKDRLDSELKALKDFSVQSGDMDLISSKSSNRPLVSLHKKSVFRYISGGCANIYGSFNDFRGGSKSKVANTPMSYHLTNEYKIKYSKPEMRSWKPWRIAALDLVNPIVDLDTSKLELCKQNYLETILSRINKGDITRMLGVLDDFTAVNGSAGITYIDKLNRNTSAGNPWKKSKRHFLIEIAPTPEAMDPVAVTDEIDERLDTIISRYLSNECSHPNFCAHLKDEPVTFAKAKSGKTRVFTGAPMDWSIVVRKYLLSVTRLIQNNREAFEAAPGTIAQSLEWHKLREYIVRFGHDRIVAGDYKAFDKRMSPKEILSAFDIISELCKLSGKYTPEDMLVIRGIAEDTAFPLVDYNGDLVQFYGSNPSGNPLTVILNSIVNSLRMRYVFLELHPDHDVFAFDQNVSLMTYGDDNIMSVSDAAPWFNHTSIAEQFEKMGIVYTMADKEAKSVPYISMSEATFLKRTWLWDDDMGCYLAPLDHESIEKMLMVWTRSKSIPEEEQVVEIISTAIREYFFYGKTKFNERRLRFKDLLNKMGLQNWIKYSTFPTWEELSQDFVKNSQNLLDFGYHIVVETADPNRIEAH
jgi:hypothetical protein